MKRNFLAAAALMAAFGLSAQVLEVQSMERVKLPEGQHAEQAILSADAKAVAYSDFDGTLNLLDRNTQTSTVISTRGSMMDLAFTSDGGAVVFREASTDARHLRHVSVKSFDIASRKVSELAGPSRTLQALDVQGATAVTVDGGRMRAKAARRGVAAAQPAPVLSIERGLLYINLDGHRELASYLGTDGMSYLWASISPDGQRMLFFAAGYGTYTCRLDGSDMRSLGYLYAPVWYDNETVVGMRTRNDGHVTTEGAIVATTLDGVRQTLTEPSLVAVLPSARVGKISFTTTDGELYILNVKKAEL